MHAVSDYQLDTLWASGYELYDRLSPPYQKFFESLDATYAQPGFEVAAKENGFELYSKPRGAPENVGSKLEAIHPVIRTNPVTGWKSIFAVGHHVRVTAIPSFFFVRSLKDLLHLEALQLV
jgi:alpha-ketoglutarate-dependent taurine dioxygenase